MNLVFILTLCSISLFLAVLGLMVFLRNPQKLINRVYLGVYFSAAAWVATNIIYRLVDDSLAHPVSLMSYMAAALVMVFLLQFILLFANHGMRQIVFFAGLIFAGLAAIPGVLSTGVEDHNVHTTPLIYAYALFILGHFVVILGLLIRHRRNAKGYKKASTNLLIVGIGLSAAGGMFFNLLLSVLGIYTLNLGQTNLKLLGPASSAILLVTTTLAIVRHRLFDMRTVVLRSLTYVILISLIGLFYIWVVLRLGRGVLAQLGYMEYIDIFNIIMIALIGISFAPAQRLFDKVSNRLFFRDTYSTAQVINSLGAVLVKTTALVALVEESLKVISSAVKPEYAAIFIDNGHYASRHSVAIGRKRLNEEVILAEIDRGRMQSVLVLDELDNSSQDYPNQLSEQGVAVVAKLVASRDPIGYMVLGYKISGGVYTKQDINLIKIAADELAVAIQNALRFEQIERFNETLQREVEDATAQLRKSNKKLRALDKAKDEFISITSHQLRTPLTSIKGYLSMTLDGDAGKLKKGQEELIEQAYFSTQRMVYMIADLLNVSRMKTGKFVLEPSTVSLAAMIREEAGQLMTTAETRGVELEFNVPTQFPSAQLDDTKIRQVIMNFIDNAIFYSRPGGVVKIKLQRENGNALLTIQDHGIGVPVEEQKHLFTKFFRASNARFVRPDGTGLGLFMAKKVIQAHGGKLIFTSKENHGSTFGFSLPMDAAVLPAKD